MTIILKAVEQYFIVLFALLFDFPHVAILENKQFMDMASSGMKGLNSVLLLRKKKHCLSFGTSADGLCYCFYLLSTALDFLRVNMEKSLYFD